MDPPLDPPPAAAPAAANPIPGQTSAHNHPPYDEMILEAITVLNELDGSSKRAIAKYIETHYLDLPQTHLALLTHHLEQLKNNGQLLMVKQSYMLPRSTSAVFNAGSTDPFSAGPKRRPGRPPKPKPDAVQTAVHVFPNPINMNAVPPVVPELNPPENVAIETPGTANGDAGVGPARGRGRPPGSSKRGRGRPKKQNASYAPVAAAAGTATSEKRPRGRPPKPINVVEGLAAPVVGGATSVAGKRRRGRPQKAGVEAKKLRNLSGKPLGRPKKNAASAMANRTADSQLLVAYLDLKAKLENLQTIVKQTAILIRPSLNNEAAITALQELELVAMNANAPSNAQNVQPPHEQPQPQI